jgi:diadenosine tetraphosphate (Ap4A) HIT family hydrolase
MKNCKTCEMIVNRNAGAVPPWDSIYRTPLWDVAHSYNTSLPGWLVLVVRRHIESLDELTEPEAVELGRLIRKASFALKEVTGCIKTYMIQFAENEEHQHVHIHIIPRMADQPENRHSTQIFGYLNVPEEERVSQEVMNAIAEKVQKILLSAQAAP